MGIGGERTSPWVTRFRVRGPFALFKAWESTTLLKRGRKQNFLDDLSNSSPAVRRYAKGRATSPPANRYRRPLQEKEKSWRSIWLPFTIPTTTTRPSSPKRCPAISTRSTARWWLPVSGFRWRPFPGPQREVAAEAAQWQGAHHRRSVHGDQGATRLSHQPHGLLGENPSY